LAKGGVGTTIKGVVEDKKRGLVSQVNRADGVTEDSVKEVLSRFANQWDWADD